MPALSGTLNLTTWPNYWSQENYDNFTKQTGVPINISVFGSNEEMLAKLQAGGTGWDVFVPPITRSRPTRILASSSRSTSS